MSSPNTDSHRILMQARYKGSQADTLWGWDLWEGMSGPFIEAGVCAKDLSDVGKMIRDDIQYLASACSDPIVERALYDLVRHQETLMNNLRALGTELMDADHQATQRGWTMTYPDTTEATDD